MHRIMRYYVKARFNTEAAGLILSSSPDENSVLLVADDCHVELRLRAPSAEFSKDANAAPILEAMPWDSSRLRTCINGISYGTGPLMLRGGDLLTLQPIATSGLNSAEKYTYSIVAVPDEPASSRNACPTSSQEAEKNRSQQERSTFSVDDQRLHAIASNMAEYAKWNNFYNDRFGSCATTPAVVNIRNVEGPLHKCSCGCYLPRSEGACAFSNKLVPGSCDICLNGASLQSSVACTPHFDASLRRGLPRMLVTLFPSIPTLLSIEETVDEGSAAVPPATVSCCACPFLCHARSGGGGITTLQTNVDDATSRSFFSQKSSRTGETSLRVSASEKPAIEDSNEKLVPTKATAWSTYVKAHEEDWQQNAAATNTEEEDYADTPSKALLDQLSAELLLRIAILEGTAMGCRYE